MQALRAPLLALALMLATAPALADEPDRPRDPTQEMEQLAREAAEQLMFALSAMLAAIPQYEMPEVLPNGDIIIRRKLPEAPEPYEKPERQPERFPGDETET